MSTDDRISTTCPVPGLDPEAYTCWRGSALGATTEALEQRLILDLIGNVSERLVLEIGCGDGSLAVELAKRGAHVVAIDASEAMIAAARLRAQVERVAIDFRVATAGKLPFQPAQFDLVAAVTVLCFVEDAAPVFGEIARVLRPGGRLVIGELNRWSTWAAERRMRAWLGSALWRSGRFRTPGQLHRLAADAGLEAGSVTGAVYFPRSERAARWMSRHDRRLARLTTFGAAFIALAAEKPLRNKS